MTNVSVLHTDTGAAAFQTYRALLVKYETLGRLLERYQLSRQQQEWIAHLERLGKLISALPISIRTPQ